MLNIEEIKKLIPQRYPFLLVDRVLELKPGESCIGIKNVSANEPFFQGHFPNKPIMPGVLIVEAMAQVGAVALMALDENKGKLAVFAGIDKVRFKRQVVPGDVLRIEVTLGKFRRNIGKGEAIVYVDGEIACKGTLMFGITKTND
ncbi:MAG: 3-hydroxyacyl-ACP dehydratase FabZ [Bacillota bacterium]|nr:3-hydroxyacyl-ACP dehydratase FabZ [Bacillota bacterium]